MKQQFLDIEQQTLQENNPWVKSNKQGGLYEYTSSLLAEFPGYHTMRVNQNRAQESLWIEEIEFRLWVGQSRWNLQFVGQSPGEDGTATGKELLRIYRGVLSSLQLSTDLYLHVRKVLRVRKIPPDRKRQNNPWKHKAGNSLCSHHQWGGRRWQSIHSVFYTKQKYPFKVKTK